MTTSTPTANAVHATASITRDAALSLLAAARDSSREIGIEVAIAITDAGGHLVAFERSDAAPFLTAGIAIDKAWTAASFGLDTLTWNHVVAAPVTAPLAHHPRVMAVGGGVPILVDGRIVGGVGISGGNAQQDHDAALAALRATGFATDK
ncbi:heme-binding protein [Mitsuaria sp. GD03876]|uniref:GlcG/HbpS family heme-binding protein n=1 Tax=Mitsuaria sp. GD03876 TaxID=2975399 RepID=UPI00244CA5ED|nr:heme-binding protein [Mitsuaria sp. GD03876]MDH0864394.1 heme-binding protein [Mitsuaria sp. GD03876]